MPKAEPLARTTKQELQTILRQIDHKGYPAYKQLRGSYRFEDYFLHIDHVQGDPFAAPSKVRIEVPGSQAGFRTEWYDTREKKIAMEDYLLCGFGKKLKNYSFQAKGSGKSGLMSVSRPGQEILERTACQLARKTGAVTLRMEIGFPANGRTVNSRELEKIFFDYLPDCVGKTLYARALNPDSLQKAAELADVSIDAFVGITPYPIGTAMYELNRAYCDKFADYVMCDGELTPFDQWLRDESLKGTYYIGGVLEYHY